MHCSLAGGSLALVANINLMTDENNLPKKVAQQLSEQDQKLLDLLGIELVEIEENRCVTRLIVRDDLANSGGVVQGGIVFALADQALAYACMSCNTAGLTLSANITFTRGAAVGDTITATAEVSFDGGGRTLTGRVDIINQDGTTIAEMTGVWLKVGKKVIDE